MFSKRLAAIPIIALVALAIPSVASANTGSVTCDSTGVVFSYNANFGRDKVSTETVNGVTQQFTVPAREPFRDVAANAQAHARRAIELERDGDTRLAALRACGTHRKWNTVNRHDDRVADKSLNRTN